MSSAGLHYLSICLMTQAGSLYFHKAASLCDQTICCLRCYSSVKIQAASLCHQTIYCCSGVQTKASKNAACISSAVSKCLLLVECCRHKEGNATLSAVVLMSSA